MPDEITSVRLGRAYSMDEWLDARDEIARVLSGAVDTIRQASQDEESQQCADRLMRTARLAVAALDYVGKNAADVCRVIELPTGSE